MKNKILGIEVAAVKVLNTLPSKAVKEMTSFYTSHTSDRFTLVTPAAFTCKHFLTLAHNHEPFFIHATNRLPHPPWQAYNIHCASLPFPSGHHQSSPLSIAFSACFPAIRIPITNAECHDVFYSPQKTFSCRTSGIQ
jgi:hypothetical protein